MPWEKTGCSTCFISCGLEVLVEDNRIVKVRGDRDNPRSEGYVCRKGLQTPLFQHHADRLRYPLKKKGDGFERISWDRAIGEIAEKLAAIIDEYGPRAFAFMGGVGGGCQLQTGLALPFLHMLGSQYHYSPSGQEYSGDFWVQGRCMGDQTARFLQDHHNSDMILAIGWNGMESHTIPQAPRKLQKVSKDPDKLLVVIDPRMTRTAKMADIHLPIRPGTDALLTRAMISIILKEGWQNRDYLDQRVSGFAAIESWFEDFDAESAIRVCELDYDQVREVCRLFATRRSCLHSDLGILMNRHSTVTSYLEVILLAVCGRICVPGGNMLPGSLRPRGRHTDERDENTWRTMVTDIPAVCGFFPPNVMPEEIMDEGPEHLRTVIVSASNPLRSYADTKAYEEAFNQLDLLVAVDISMTETAALAHYVFPSRSAFESWDASFMPLTYPEIFCQMRRPIIEPDGEQREAGEVFLRLAEAMDLIPPIPSSLHEAAQAGYGPEFRKAFADFTGSNPEAANAVPFVMARTLGQALGSVNLASLCATLENSTKTFQGDAQRAGFAVGPSLPDDLYSAIMEHPEGLWAGKTDPENNFSLLGTTDGRVNLHIPELEDWVLSIDAVQEEDALKPDSSFPLVLMAGRHFRMNANTQMRDPVWNKGRRACTLTMHPEDAETLGFSDGDTVRVITEAGDAEIELEVAGNERPGHVTIPHGFGLQYQGTTYGVNVNTLTKNTHRDPLLGTPFHRYVPCRVEATGE